jgi:hypothetical protein
LKRWRLWKIDRINVFNSDSFNTWNSQRSFLLPCHRWANEKMRRWEDEKMSERELINTFMQCCEMCSNKNSNSFTNICEMVDMVDIFKIWLLDFIWIQMNETLMRHQCLSFSKLTQYEDWKVLSDPSSRKGLSNQFPVSELSQMWY